MQSETRRVFKSVTSRSKYLLGKPEDFDVDFKESLAGLGAEDLVAFANSLTGGAILLGVREILRPDGLQGSEIIGCEVGDRNKLAIANKAESCIPAVLIDIFIENTNGMPFFRIEIPPSERSPHCTGGGKYVTRGDGRMKTIAPSELLLLFLMKEEENFLTRFKDATSSIEMSIDDIKDRLADIRSLELLLDETRESLEQYLQDIGSFVETASADAEEAASTALLINDRVESNSYAIERFGRDTSYKLDAILTHLNLENPVPGMRKDEIVLVIYSALIHNVPREQIRQQLIDRYGAFKQEQFDSMYQEASEEFEGFKK